MTGSLVYGGGPAQAIWRAPGLGELEGLAVVAELRFQGGG
jgi:hypothetical protein